MQESVLHILMKIFLGFDGNSCQVWCAEQNLKSCDAQKFFEVFCLNQCQKLGSGSKTWPWGNF
jgi:hypothetical protein